MKRSYSTDLADAEWECLSSHVPAPNKRGRPRIHSSRVILDAIFYVLRSGCPWRLLPREFPPWETIYYWFRRCVSTEPWSGSTGHYVSAYEHGWEETRSPAPVSSILSRPRRAEPVANRGGYDGGKKVRGRKRHLLVDTEGLVLKAKVHSAKVTDQDGIKKLPLKTTRERLPRLSHLWVDASYQGRGKEWVEQGLGLSVEVVHRTPKPTS